MIEGTSRSAHLPIFGFDLKFKSRIRKIAPNSSTQFENLIILQKLVWDSSCAAERNRLSCTDTALTDLEGRGIFDVNYCQNPNLTST